jgi:TonB family protein
MNMVLAKPKPLSYSLSVSLVFHALFVLLLGRTFLFGTTPLPLNESQTEFRVIHKKPPIANEKIPEPKIEKPVTITPVAAQPMASPIVTKTALMPSPSIASMPIDAQPIEEVRMPTFSSSSRSQVVESSASPMPFNAEVRPQVVPVGKVVPHRYGRRAMVQGGVPASFAQKPSVSAPQSLVSVATSTRKAIGIKSSVSMEVFTATSAKPFTTTSHKAKGNAPRAFYQSGVRAFSSLSMSPRSHTELTDAGVLKAFLGGIQRIIASAKRYPEGERQALHTGKMKVAFTLLRNGNIENLRLKEKSEHKRLNQAALDAVSRGVPFTKFPEGIIEDSIDVVIPFRFDLR